MASISRLKNQIIARLTSRFPSVAQRFARSFSPLETEGVPWAPLNRPLAHCKVAVVTTAGIHHRDQTPFDMRDPDGDPTFRPIDVSKPANDLMITHDYYDHSDAEKDINIIFPIQRLWELQTQGLIGKVAKIHYGFMGHIRGLHIQTLIKESAPEVAQRLVSDAVDVVLLTPG